MDVDAIAGELRSGGFVAVENALSPAVRAWLDDSKAADRSFLTVMEELRIGLNQHLFLGLLHYECHYAIYGVGAHYEKHLDTLSGQKNRLLSTAVYLHDEWTP